MKVQGVDQSVLNNIQERTKKTKVQDTEQVRINTEERKKQREQAASQEGLEQAVNKLNKTVEAFNIQLKFAISKKDGDIIVFVIDKAKNEVIRQIPPDKVVNLTAQMQYMVGLIVDEFI